MEQVRKTLGEHGETIKIVAKIDTLEGVQRYKEIVEEADAVIFVRQELQWELQPEKLMIAQKWCIAEANAASKPIMIQSQLLESMTKETEPLRREITEISQATLDGADSFMLSHETSVGANPVESLTALAKAIAEAENIFDYD